IVQRRTNNMKNIFDVKDEPTDDVYDGQVRKDEFGVFAIVSKGESADEPFNPYLFTESVDVDVYGVSNRRAGTTADRIRAEFPATVGMGINMLLYTEPLDNHPNGENLATTGSAEEDE